MESAYLNWARGNRISNYAGLQSLGDATYRYSDDYIELYIPLLEAYYPKEEQVVSEAKVNQLLRLIPACTLDVKKYRVQVEVNPKLLDHALVQAPSMITPNDKDVQPIVTAKFYRPMNMSELDYVIRLRLMG